MKVKAKWAVKVNGVWYRAGDVFEVDSTAGLLNSVTVLERNSRPKKTEAEPVVAEEAKPENTEEAKPEKEETKPEPKAEPKPRTATRTRKTTAKK